MYRALPRLSRFLLASALVFAPSPSAAAMTEPAPTTDAIGRAPIPCWPPIKCLLKYDAGVAGPAFLQSAEGQPIEVLAWDWRAPGTPSVASSDPQEGGEVVSGVDSSATAEARSRKRGAGGASLGEITPTKKADKASPILMSKGSGGTAGEQVEEPLPAGTLTVRLARGAATKGKHFPEVTLTARGRAYRLRDVVVTECAATGENTDTCTLSYQGLGG
jgi:type VI protein secretion system component Hcp